MIKTENEVDDLFLISLCDYIISANSTFSWWASALSGHRNVCIPNFKWYDNCKERFVLPGWKYIDKI